MNISFIQMKKYLRSHLPRWTLLCLLGCWAALAGASEVRVPEIPTPAPLGSSRHHLGRTADGRLILSWVEQAKAGKKKKVSRLRFTVREEGGWSTPRTVATFSHPLFTVPAVVGLSDGALAAAWMVDTGDFNLEIYVSRSTDRGKHWSAPIKPYASPLRVGDGQISLAPLKNGHLAVAWLAKKQKSAPLQLMGAVLYGKGKPGSAIVLNKDVCSCCKTATVARGNTLWMAYRDLLEGNVRDIGLVRWSSGGPAKSAIVHEDHWVIDGCPVNGPAVDSRAGLAMVSWFTAADGKDGKGRVLTAFTHNGVKRFGEPITVDGNANGHVEALLLEDGSALVAWRDRAGPTEKLQLAQVRQDGAVYGPTTVYRGPFAPWLGQLISLAKVGDSVYVAWIDSSVHRVRLVKVPLASVTAPPETLAKAE